LEKRERVLTALRRQIPDKVPCELSFGAFTPALMEIYREKTGSTLPPEEYFDFETRPVRFREPQPENKYDKYFKNKNIDKIKSWGTAVIQGSEYHFTKKVFPLENIKDTDEIKTYPFPDYTPEKYWSHIKKETKDFHNKGYAVMGELECTIFEIAWDLRGFDNLLIDFMENSKIAKILIDKITEIRIFQAKKYAEAGVDILRLGDDIGMQTGLILSKYLWRKWLKTPLQKVIECAKNINNDILIFYHSDGNIEPVIPELIEIGIDILNPVQPECMDPAKIKKEYGDRLSFWGTIGTQKLMPFGTPNEVKNEVKRIINTVGKRGGLLLAPTHILEPEVPWENILSFFEAVELYGYY